MPAHTAALVMRAQPGAELTCQGHNYDLPPGTGTQSRGVLSYYATATLPTAQTMGDWLAQIEKQVQQDGAMGTLPAFYRPNLQLLGDSDQPLPSAKG
ncbi:MAG: hypothetical protein R3E79_10075 [Caldilineaceae bacterium]